MDLDAPHISSNGEIISKRELISEIENLLNGVALTKTHPHALAHLAKPL